MSVQPAWRRLPEPQALWRDAPSRGDDRVELVPLDLVVEALGTDAAALHDDAWADLASRCLEPNPFMEPGFCVPAARHLAPADAPTFLLVWGETTAGRRRLVSVCALARSKVPGWPVAGLWFHDMATLGAPLLCRDHAAPALIALLSWMDDHLPAQTALGVMALDSAGPTARLLAAVALQSGRRVQSLDARRRAILDPHEALVPAGLAALSSRRAKEIQRQRRRLAERGTLRYDSVSDPQAMPEALDRFLTLEAGGWKGRAGTALAKDEARSAFVKAMTDRMASRGRCRIDTLWLDAQPIAMGLLISSGERDYFWKTAFAEEHAALSPGVQFVLDLTQRQQKAHDPRFTDSCAIPDHPMIDRLWSGRLDVVDMLIEIHPRSGLAFRLGVGLERARRGGRARLKRLYGRWRGSRSGQRGAALP